MKNFLQLLIINYTFLILNCYAQQPGWEIIPSGTTNSLQAVHFADYNTGYAVGESETICKTTDGGLTWQSSSSGGSVTLYDVFAFDQNNVIVVGSGGLIIRTADGGITWFFVPSGVTEELFSISFNGINGICGGSNQTILYSTNSGVSWNIGQTGFFGGGFYGASMLTPQIGFVAGENSIFQPLLGKTTDSGVSWDFTAFYLNNNEGRATGVDFTDLNTGYVSASVWDGTGAIAKTTDAGSNWISTMFTNPLWSIDFPISGASQVGYAVGSQGTILKTYDAGMNWLPQQSGTNIKLNKVHFKDFDFGFAVGDGGIILRTTEGGVPVELTSFSAIVNEREILLNWTTATETNNRGFEVEKLFGHNWVVIGFVEGNGTTTETKSYSFRDEDLETGIHKYRLKQIDYDGTFEYSENVEAEVTALVEFELSQNFPNPFNPSTSIEYAIGSRQFVQLKVYDVLGNEIATLVNEEKPSGIYNVQLTMNDLGSGIYFYQLNSGNFVETKKMILMK